MILSTSQNKVLNCSNAPKAFFSEELDVLLNITSTLAKEERRIQEVPSFFKKRRNKILENGNDESKTPIKILKSQK